MKRLFPLVAALLLVAMASCSERQSDRLMSPSTSDGGDSGARRVTHGAQPDFEGIARVGVVLVEFNDTSPFNLPAEEDFIVDRLFNSATSVDALFQEMSWGVDGFELVDPQVDVMGPYRISANSSPCPTFGSDPRLRAWNEEAVDSAMASGATFAPYDIVVFFYARGNACDNHLKVGGIAFRGTDNPTGRPEASLFFWYNAFTSVAHELGHLRGWHHSGLPGGTNPYGDLSCLMGDNFNYQTDQVVPMRQANAVWKYDAGYIREQEIVDLTAGNHTVYLAPTQRKWDNFPSGAPGTLYHAARITVSPGEVYYISYRKGDESVFDNNPLLDDVMDRVHIHRTNASRNADITREAMLEVNDTFVGESFEVTAVTDPAGTAGFVEVTVDVSGKAPAIVNLNPSPLYAHNESAGPAPQTFTLSITNPDAPGAPATLFNIVVDEQNPAFTIALQDTLTLAAGSFVQLPVQLNFSSPPAEGPYNFTITVDEEVGRAPSSAPGVYWNDLTPPPAPANLAGVPSVSNITLTWTIVLDLGVRYEVLKNGATTFNTYSTTLVDEDVVPNQTYEYQVRAIDGAGHVGLWSPPIQVTTACSNAFVGTMTSGAECKPLAYCRTTPLPPYPYGTVATFTLEIENTDSPSCGAATYTVSPGTGSDQFSFSGLAGQQNVAGGATVSDPFQIHFIPNNLPPDPLVEGRYSFTVSISDAAGYASTQIIPIQFIYDTAAPTTPGNLTATLTMNSVTLDWTAATDAVTSVTGYEVLRDGQSLGTTTGLTFTDEYVISDCATYEVVARDEVGHLSAPASADVGQGPIVTIDPPSLVTNNTSPGFTLTIENVDGPGCPPGAFDIMPSTSPNFTVTTATGQLVVSANSEGSTTGTLAASANGVHAFMITVTDATTARIASVAMATYTIDTVVPTRPSTLGATVIAYNQVRLKWKASSDALSGIAYYEIERDGEIIATATGISYVDNVDIMLSHTYYVRAYDHAGNASTWSPAATSGPTPAP